jgi:dienelactone hydrolase
MRYLFTLLLVTVFYTVSIAGENITYSVDGQQYEGYFINTKSGAPLVLIIHDWDGLTDYEIKRAQMLAELGYSVFAADLFGAGVRPTEVKDKRQHTGELYKDRPKMRRIINGALDTAKAQGLNTENAVIAGYCFGGAAVLEFARSGADLKGFVTFHGGLETPEGQDYSSAKGKFLNHVEHEMITYSGAPHAFTVFDTERYREDADKKSWQRFTEFVGDILQ